MDTSDWWVPDTRNLNTGSHSLHTDGEKWNAETQGCMPCVLVDTSLQKLKLKCCPQPLNTKALSAGAKAWSWNALCADIYKCFPLLAGEKPKDFLTDYPVLRNQVSRESCTLSCPVHWANGKGVKQLSVKRLWKSIHVSSFKFTSSYKGNGKQ